MCCLLISYFWSVYSSDFISLPLYPFGSIWHHHLLCHHIVLFLPAAVGNSWRLSSATGGSDIYIRNRLVKQAAWASLRCRPPPGPPTAASSADSGCASSPCLTWSGALPLNLPPPLILSPPNANLHCYCKENAKCFLIF